MKIGDTKFWLAHQAFAHYMEVSSHGIPFTSFQHPFLFKDEIAYKTAVYHDGQNTLDLSKWKQYQKTPGHILRAVQETCKQEVSQNLLEHRYGLENSSEGALYKVRTPEQIVGLETQLVDYFMGGSDAPDEFGARFDDFAEYLRRNRLGCKWAFVAYLAFLLAPQRYFPVLPTRFDALLKYYGVDQTISGYVSWDRYKLVLELADTIKSKLALYAPASAIEIQSYMWVVSYLLPIPQDGDQPNTPDFDAELLSRKQQAAEKERIGLLGEKYVYEQEKKALIAIGRPDLANRVRLVSFETVGEADRGFDLLSFTPNGQELHVEVKTTTRSRNGDNGFWLSENERLKAQEDTQWVVYRAWDITGTPSYANIGNIVSDKNSTWSLVAANWRAAPSVEPKSAT